MKEEILKNILMSEDVVTNINSNISVLTYLMPEIRDMIEFEHKHPKHHLDVWDHTLLALSLSKRDFEIRLCLLLHDIGKPHSYQEGEIRHFKGHPKVSSNMSRNILKRLEFDTNFIDKMCYLIENHDNPIKHSDILANFNISFERYLIQYCDQLAHNPDCLEKKIKYLNDTLELFKKYDPNLEKNVKRK